MPAPPRGTLSSTGRKGVCGKPGKGVLHEDDPHFSELFEALKNASAWRKDFFDTLKSDAEKASDFFMNVTLLQKGRTKPTMIRP